MMGQQCLNCSSPVDDIGPVYLCPLHAAASDLLEALEYVQQYSLPLRMMGALEKVDAAIAKATKP